MRRRSGRGGERVGVGLSLVRGSAKECALMLVASLAISLGCGLLLPHVRAKLWPSFTGDAQNLMLIEDTRAAERGEARLSREQYLTWAARRQRVFQSFAFYEVRREVVGDSVGRERVTMAYATANLFDVLRSGVKGVSSANNGRMQGVVVSPELWRAVAENLADSSAPVIRIGAQGVCCERCGARGGFVLAWAPECLGAGAKRDQPGGCKWFHSGACQPELSGGHLA